MKKLLAVFLLLVAATALASTGVITRGAAIPTDLKVVALTKVLEAPDQYTAHPIVVEGIVEAACQNKGCWMQIAPEAGKPGMRITFKDYGFFVPKDSKGAHARMAGVVEVKTLSKAEADHLAGEGAKLNRNEDGTGKEVSFVASGVELRRE
jgi:hypothetical protein